MKGFFFVCFLNLVIISFAQSAELTAKQAQLAKTIFGNTMSPYCPGRLLEDCPSSSASELKEKIRQRVAEGESKESIEEYLYSVYGESIRATPGFSGFGVAAWLGPVIFLAIGLMFITYWLRRNIKSQELDTTSKIDSNWNDKIDREI